ncbi:cell death specification protein-like, partial [Tropilaelaps mercedesae]
MTNESPLSSSGSSSSPSLLIASAHNGLAGHGIGHANIDGHGRPNGLAVPPLPPPPFLSQLAQPGANHIMQQMQHQHHGVNGVSGGGILLAANDSKGRHSSFSSVNSSDGAVSPPPHTLPTPTHHSGNSLNQHQLPFVPQHIPHDLVHKMSSGQKKKLPTPIPKECKDEAYWERRKRNNESAKRSRELRRIKEQQTTLRVLYLEQENLQLRTELGMLRSEVDKLRQLLYVTNKQQSRGGVQQATHASPPQAM